MSYHQAGSVGILVLGLALIFISAPVLRLATRNSVPSGLGHEGELIMWITRILGFIIAMLGLMTYLQS